MSTPAPTQLPLGLALKREGQAKAFDAESELTREALAQAIAGLAARGEPFTAEDARRVMAGWGIAEPAHPCSVGAAFTHAATAGLIEAAGFTTASRDQRRGSVLRLWVGR